MNRSETRTQHTPGPWVIRKIDTHPFKDARPWFAVGPKINGAVHFVASQCYEEDARLIAAAPELLEALEAMVEAAPNSAVKQIARAAIATAKGEQA